jgi:hypothetical protein
VVARRDDCPGRWCFDSARHGWMLGRPRNLTSLRASTSSHVDDEVSFDAGHWCSSRGFISALESLIYVAVIAVMVSSLRQWCEAI